jgi:hypothetical protein
MFCRGSQEIKTAVKRNFFKNDRTKIHTTNLSKEQDYPGALS